MNYPKKNIAPHIIEAVAKGDPAAFRHIFEAYFAQMVNFSLTIVREQHLAEEVVEEVLLRMWKNRGKIREVDNLDAYLFKAVRNQSLNSQQQKLKHNNHFVSLNHSNTQTLASDSADQPMLTAEMTRIIEEAVDALPKRCKTVFELTKYEGLKYRETAQRLGIAEKTVERQIGIALKKIAQAIEAYKMPKKLDEQERDPSDNQSLLSFSGFCMLACYFF